MPKLSLHANTLVKAMLYPSFKGSRVKLADGIEVQFNPSEYQITRSTNLSKKHPIGVNSEAKDVKPATGSSAALSMTLYFDDITEETLANVAKLGRLASLVKSESITATKLSAITELLKFAPDKHTLPEVQFVWGSLDFTGLVSSQSISYTMFRPDGTPVRAKLSLTLVGEETEVYKKNQQNKPMSPNRTKERLLTEGDSLWMLAHKEYDDPALWREIAQANGILNPRKLQGASVLKVPSIK